MNFTHYRKTMRLIFLLSVVVGLSMISNAQKKAPARETTTAVDTLKSSSLSGLKWRGIGPAFASGRIADFAVNPNSYSEYYVGVASGHIWKTVNNGTTFTPIFDNYGVYAIGAITMDPNNPFVVWAGTGENNHQRALGYGNGVYKTDDGGKSWKNMGLKNSRQIGEILIDPRNSNIVYVAAEGSAWGPGGDRGLYKTTDGGKTWEKILNVSENTGINNVVFDPRNPDVLFATSEQRRRHVWGKIGGGPESAVYKSIDAGKSWQKLTRGLPSGHVGGMGIAVSPVNPDIIYIIAEAADDNGGFFRSTDRGASFEKMSSYNASGQYYNVIFCDPVNPDKVFSMDVVSKVTYDGGKTWNNLSTSQRHVDDHAFWIDPRNTRHWMIGGDGGIYETWDDGQTFIHKTNLPVTQFYRVNVDDTKPFYWVYGGTQDNNSQGGPSRNTTREGVSSCEWIVTLGGDGFWQAIEKGNPDIVYSAYQYGNISRYDKRSAERVRIRPEPRKGELTYKWNWDAPFILSHHMPTRLYMGAERLFRSDDRGDSWDVISPDLTRGEDRNQFKIMDKYWPSNAVMKNVSTSQWGTIVSLAESPLKKGLLFVGTDDGLIQITEDDGNTWFKASSFAGVPEYTYVSDILPSRFDENVVYASFNNIKRDDFKPYLLKSADKGRTWTTIAANLPNETVHTIAQDFVNPDLLFVGTEFSFYLSVDGGKTWVRLNSGLPDIAVRDITIHEGENDLVIATFGRGFYILDDYSPLRKITTAALKENKAILFPVKNALMYLEAGGSTGSGHTFYTAPNPPFGAIFTYYLKDIPRTLKQERLRKEKDLFEKSLPIPQPTKDILDAEEREVAPYLLFTIRDDKGEVVRKLYETPKQGMNRINWRLRYDNPAFMPSERGTGRGIAANADGAMILPGNYSVKMELVHNNKVIASTDEVNFRTVVLNNTTLPAQNREELTDFISNVADLRRVTEGSQRYLAELKSRNEAIRQTLQNMTEAPSELITQSRKLGNDILDIEFKFSGTRAQASAEEVPPEQASISHRMGAITASLWTSSSNPTQTMKSNYSIVKESMTGIISEIQSIADVIKKVESKLDELYAPYTPGRLPKLR